MVRFGEKEIAREKFYASKKPIKIWDGNVDNTVNIVTVTVKIVISKLVKQKLILSI